MLWALNGALDLALAGACGPHAPWNQPVQGAGHGWWVRALWIVLQWAGLVLGTSCSSPCARGAAGPLGPPPTCSLAAPELRRGDYGQRSRVTPGPSLSPVAVAIRQRSSPKLPSCPWSLLGVSDSDHLPCVLGWVCAPTWHSESSGILVPSPWFALG